MICITNMSDIFRIFALPIRSYNDFLTHVNSLLLFDEFNWTRPINLPSLLQILTVKTKLSRKFWVVWTSLRAESCQNYDCFCSYEYDIVIMTIYFRALKLTNLINPAKQSL